MTRSIPAAAAALILLVGCGAALGGAASDDDGGMLGRWLTEDGVAHVQIENCDDNLCGRIVWMAEPLTDQGQRKLDVYNPKPELRNRPILGLQILNIASDPDKRGVYRGGSIYDPESGKTYRCNMRLESDSVIKMRGFLGISLIGRSTRWTRVPERLTESAQDPKASVSTSSR